uniref:Uncharacterized protein n=1 Tax=Knipowitschia caucasica TaxID=637954 RepID=A0AAV2L1Y0_KNICA
MLSPTAEGRERILLFKTRGSPQRPEEVLRDQRKTSQSRGSPHRAEEVLTDQRKSSQSRGSPHRAEEVLTEQRKSSQNRGSPQRPEEVKHLCGLHLSVVFSEDESVSVFVSSKRSKC